MFMPLMGEWVAKRGHDEIGCSFAIDNDLQKVAFARVGPPHRAVFNVVKREMCIRDSLTAEY